MHCCLWYCFILEAGLCNTWLICSWNVVMERHSSVIRMFHRYRDAYSQSSTWWSPTGLRSDTSVSFSMRNRWRGPGDVIKSGFSEKAARCLHGRWMWCVSSSEKKLIDHSLCGDGTQVLCRLQINDWLLELVAYRPFDSHVQWKLHMGGRLLCNPQESQFLYW